MLLILVLLLQVALPPAKSNEANVDSALLESGKAATLRKPAPDSSEIKIVSYNIRWRGGEELKALATVLREDAEVGGASILALQEVDRSKKRTGHSNTVKTLADALGLHYVWAAPPTANAGDEEETGVAILSVYPLSDVRRIVLPNAGPNRRRRVALGATIELGGRSWRIYSAHAETRIPISKKLEQYSAILDDIKRSPPDMPAIIMGDFNTWEPTVHGKTAKLFSNAGMSTPFGSETTFRRRLLFVPVELRLDWVWLRGLEADGCGVDKKIEISDHWPLWTKVRPTGSTASKK